MGEIMSRYKVDTFPLPTIMKMSFKTCGGRRVPRPLIDLFLTHIIS